MSGAPVALITGPTAGVGLGFARALADRGHDLVLVSRDAARLEEIAADLRARTGVDVEVLPADLAVPDDCARVEQRLADVARPVGVLVNNAGFGLRTGFLRSSVADEQRMIDVMVSAVMRLTHAALPGMVARQRGVVINVSSVASWLTGGTYSAAKAWVTVFSESLSVELAGTGVRVSACCPGFMHTEFHDRAGISTASVPEWMWIEVDDVVRTALADAAANRPLSVAGPQYKLLATVLRHAPRSLVRRVGGIRSRTRATPRPGPKG